MIDRLLGVRLPSDYREFVLAYPAIELDGFLRVFAPVPGLEEGFVDEIREELEILGDLYESGDDLSGGYAPHPAENGLLPWGTSLSGDTFFWKVTADDGDRWPVVVGGRNGDWWEFEGGLIAFLVGLIDGTVERRGLPRDVPSARPRVHVFTD
ncbi:MULTISPECIES: SMI1/KNR4 family protein [unclassified Streptomyces]|uniref:SMI1/KNR4 family protein n=1 Tax=unclassified Streptomyces TaxID=2593676 RepID=UPI000D147A26|nr:MULTISPECIES: SMI1/KNR4 family protein [unclassified Streptomyces]